MQITSNLNAAFHYQGHYADGALYGGDYKYIFTFSFNEDVSGSMGDGDLLIDPVTGSDPPPTYVEDEYWDADTNTATYAISYDERPLPDANYRAVLGKDDINGPTGDKMTDDAIVDFFTLGGDATHDRSVNISDLSITASHFQTSGNDFTQGDFNYDSNVDISDMTILASNWNVTLPAPPSAPGAVTVGNQSAASIELNWLNSQPSAVGYRIERSTDGEIFNIVGSPTMGDSSLTFNGNPSSTTTDVSWTDSTVADGTRYWYRVRAYDNGAGLDTAYTPKQAATTMLPMVSDLTVSAISSHKLGLTWTKPSTRTNGFEIFRSTTGTGSWAQVATVGGAAGTNTYTDTVPNSATTYYYQIIATNPWTTSMPSTPVSGTTLTIVQDMAAEISALISGKTASTDPASTGGDTLDLFSTADDTSSLAYPDGHYVRNPNLWAAGIDLTSIPVWNSFWAGLYPPYKSADCGILISPSYLIQAAHFGVSYDGDVGAMPPGTTVRFVTNDNQVVTRTVADNNPNDDSGGTDALGYSYGPNQRNGIQLFGTDIRLIELSSPVPATIKPAHVFDHDVATYMNGYTTDLPVAFGNQFRQLHIAAFDYADASSVFVKQPAMNSIFRDWDATIIPGDSSSPLFSILNGTPVVFGTWTGPPYSYNGYVPNLEASYADIASIIGTSALTPYVLG